MTPGIQHRRPSQSPVAPGPSSAESEKRRLQRTSDDEARISTDLLETDGKRTERLEDQPTEPRNTVPSYHDTDWEAPTIPDGKILEAWDIDERG